MKQEMLDAVTRKRYQLIREYVALQKKLVTEAWSKLRPDATEYDFEDSLPTSITIDDGTTWLTNVHGLGVMFISQNTKIVVDVHEGFIDSPNAFDAWRLVEFSESKYGTDEAVESWQRTLDALVHNGMIIPHSRHERHYVLT